MFVDNVDVPFGLSPGDTPYMTAQNEADLLCFLETLTDGYVQGVPSTVFDPGTGESDVADYRNNQAMYFLPGETPLVAILDARFSQIMNLPIDHGEGRGSATRPTSISWCAVLKPRTSRCAAAGSESALS